MSFHAFKGQRTSRTLPKPQAFSQAIFRDARSSFDQHGRPWSWPADKATGMPCGPLAPEGWNAPWLLDQGPEFYVLNVDNTTELFLNYRAFVKSRVTALREFHDQALRAARKAQMPSPKIGQYSEALLEAMGVEPPRAYQLAIACEQGNPWALGFDTKPDPRLVEYLEGPSTVVEEAFEAFDFGPESYAGETGGKGRTAEKASTTARKFKSFEELKADMVSGKTAAEELLEFEAAATDRTAEDVEAETVGVAGSDVTDEVLNDIAEETEEVEGESMALEDGAGEGDALEDLEETADEQALGGKRVDPRSVKAGGSGKKKEVQRGRSNARVFDKGKRPTLADGARPVVSEG